VKIGLERIDTQKGVTVEALLDSGVSYEFGVCQKAVVQTEENKKTNLYKKCRWNVQ